MCCAAIFKSKLKENQVKEQKKITIAYTSVLKIAHLTCLI